MKQQRIFSIIAKYFPGMDFFHTQQGGQHTFKMILARANTRISIVPPPGFLIGEIHLQSSRGVFTLITTDALIAEYYPITTQLPTPCFAA